MMDELKILKVTYLILIMGKLFFFLATFVILKSINPGKSNSTFLARRMKIIINYE